MSKIKGVNTTPEILLRKELWKLGLRYRLNVPNLPGKPDIVIKKRKLVIFIDGEFWHGHEWKKKKQKIKRNKNYWIKKIEGNIKRDKKNTILLKSLDYTVLRFWEHQIRSNLPMCINKIESILSRNDPSIS